MESATLTEKLDKLITDVAVMKAEQAILFPPLKKMLDDHETRIRATEKATENIQTKVGMAGAAAGTIMSVVVAWIWSKFHL